jgi:hypothetical protein
MNKEAKMVDERSRKRLPPYVSYRTFLNFAERLEREMPARIDRSYWSDRLAGSTGTQLMGALRFLGLVDSDGVPTSQLRQLVSARGDKRAELLRQIATESYNFVLGGSFDFHIATYAQLEEVFHRNFELADDVNRKCIKFFVALASDAGIPLSSFITKRVRRLTAGAGTKAKRKSSKSDRNLVLPHEIVDELTTKFPTFDPSWSDEVKLKWFDAFDKLLTRSLVKAKR